MYGVELAGAHAVATAYTAEETTRLASCLHGGDGTAAGSVIPVNTLTVVAGTVAPDHSDHGNPLLDRMTGNGCNLLHNLTLANRALQAIHRVLFHAGLGKSRTTGEAAASAVRSGQELGYLTHSRVRLHCKFPCHGKQDQTQNQSGYTQHKDCCQNW